jgi:hypothetical protein
MGDFKTLSPGETEKLKQMAYDLANAVFDYMDKHHNENDDIPDDMFEIGSQADSIIELIYG